MDVGIQNSDDGETLHYFKQSPSKLSCFFKKINFGNRLKKLFYSKVEMPPSSVATESLFHQHVSTYYIATTPESPNEASESDESIGSSNKIPELRTFRSTLRPPTSKTSSLNVLDLEYVQCSEREVGLDYPEGDPLPVLKPLRFDKKHKPKFMSVQQEDEVVNIEERLQFEDFMATSQKEKSPKEKLKLLNEKKNKLYTIRVKAREAAKLEEVGGVDENREEVQKLDSKDEVLIEGGEHALKISFYENLTGVDLVKQDKLASPDVVEEKLPSVELEEVAPNEIKSEVIGNDGSAYSVYRKLLNKQTKKYVKNENFKIHAEPSSEHLKLLVLKGEFVEDEVEVDSGSSENFENSKSEVQRDSKSKKAKLPKEVILKIKDGENKNLIGEDASLKETDKVSSTKASQDRPYVKQSVQSELNETLVESWDAKPIEVDGKKERAVEDGDKSYYELLNLNYENLDEVKSASSDELFLIKHDLTAENENGKGMKPEEKTTKGDLVRRNRRLFGPKFRKLKINLGCNSRDEKRPVHDKRDENDQFKPFPLRLDENGEIKGARSSESEIRCFDYVEKELKRQFSNLQLTDYRMILKLGFNSPNVGIQTTFSNLSVEKGLFRAGERKNNIFWRKNNFNAKPNVEIIYKNSKYKSYDPCLASRKHLEKFTERNVLYQHVNIKAFVFLCASKTNIGSYTQNVKTVNRNLYLKFV